MTSDELDRFQAWVDMMEDALAAFFEVLPKDVTSQLDYSIESIEALERWLLSRYPHSDAAKAAKEAPVLDGVARYFGEAFRAQFGGDWSIRVDDPDYAYFGLPIVDGFPAKESPVCPLVLASASLDRRTGVHVSKIMRAKQQRISRAAKP